LVILFKRKESKNDERKECIFAESVKRMNQNIDKLLIQGVSLSFLSVLTQKRHYLLPLPGVLHFAMSVFDFIFDHYQLIEKPNFAA
jgi:hypothetical protein